MKKLTVYFVLLFCCMLSAANFVFADRGRADYVIVLPDKTAGFEEQAAKDLQMFFGKCPAHLLKSSVNPL